MALVAIVALAALVIAAISLIRLSRVPKASPPAPERSFDNLTAGDVVLTPEGEALLANFVALAAAPRAAGARR